MITLKNLSFKYHAGQPSVLNNINLHISSGEKVLIVGKNGAGKSTLSKTLAGLAHGHERGEMTGEYIFEGSAIGAYSRKEISQKIAVLFQDFETQLVCSSVKEELLFYLMNLGADYLQALTEAKKTAQRFGVNHLFDRDIHELSGGEKQKIALLSLLTISPKLLILDEPFTDIEPATQKLLAQSIGSGDCGETIVLFEQVLDYYKYFNRIIVMNKSAIVYDGDEGVIADKSLLNGAGLAVPGIRRLFQGNNFAAYCESLSFDESAYNRISVKEVHKNPACIEVKGLCFAYSGLAAGQILSNVDLSISKGDFVVVLGPNGSGKTTLTKCIAGILKPTRGEVLYNGRKVKPGDIGYIYQNPDNQIFAETVFDEIAFALRMKNLNETIVRDKVNALMATMGLEDKSDLDPFALPKGDRQKVACASILVAEPEVIILDEPTTGLDFPSLLEMMKIIKDLNMRGKTILMITHSMETAASFGSTALALKDGVMTYLGPMRDFFTDENNLKESKTERTEIMDLSLKLKGKLLLNEDEFIQCWRENP
jgi:energy-coupling factor transporter ATP-binding protein EcfA2